MKKAFIRKTITAATIAATVATIAPLGVSAQWRETTDSTTTSYVQSNKVTSGWKLVSNKWYYYDANGKVKTGWIYYNGAWYYTNNSGEMQTGVIKVNGKTYYLNKSGAMQIGRVVIGNTAYYFANSGAAIGTKIPACDKEFDANNNLVKPNTNTGNNNSGNSTGNNSGSTNGGTNSGNTNSGNNNSGSNNNGSTNSGNTNSGATNNGTNSGSVNVNGLPQVTQKYSVTVQSSAETTILNLMNQKRTEAGLKPLTMDNTLLSVARYKSNHMIQNGYFSHTNPDGTKWTNWLQTLGYSYTTTGENIAYNTSDPVELFNQWWNSQGHRDNMMNPNYTKVGIGVVFGNGKYMGTQEFSN